MGPSLRNPYWRAFTPSAGDREPSVYRLPLGQLQAPEWYSGRVCQLAWTWAGTGKASPRSAESRVHSTCQSFAAGSGLASSCSGVVAPPPVSYPGVAVHHRERDAGGMARLPILRLLQPPGRAAGPGTRPGWSNGKHILPQRSGLAAGPFTFDPREGVAATAERRVQRWPAPLSQILLPGSISVNVSHPGVPKRPFR